MKDVRLDPLTRECHAEDVLDLVQRAADYVVLEVGHAPDAAYVEDFFTAAPPGVSENGLIHLAITYKTALAGLICIAEGYEFPEDWWLGLVLIDPAFRGQGLGRAAIDQIKGRARDRGIAMIKLAVLDANQRAIKFWRREGFAFHRHAPALPGSDGHDRTVLKFIFHTPPDRPF